MKDFQPYLTAPLGRYFRQEMQARGEALYMAGHLSFAKATPDHFQAIIRSGGFATVTLRRTADDLQTHCSCADWVSYGVCRHLWAALLEAEERGSLGGTRSDSPKNMRRLDQGSQPGDYRSTPVPPPPPAWKKTLGAVKAAKPYAHERSGHEPEREFEFWLVTDMMVGGSILEVKLESRERTQSGAWGKLKAPRYSRRILATLQGPFADLLRRSVGLQRDSDFTQDQQLPSAFRLTGPDAADVLKDFCASGRYLVRAFLDDDFDKLEPAAFDDGPPWRFQIRMEPRNDDYVLYGVVERDGESLDLGSISAAYPNGVLRRGATWARLDLNGGWEWLATLRRENEVRVPKTDAAAFVNEVMASVPTTAIAWPSDLAFQETRGPAVPFLELLPPSDRDHRQSKMARGRLTFIYGDQQLDPGRSREPVVTDIAARRMIVRDLAGESAATLLLAELGAKKKIGWTGDLTWEIAQSRVPRLMMTLVERGWHVKADGALLRRADEFRAKLTTGIDWFELEGDVRFGDTSIKLPELLKTLRKGENMIQLGDGTFGLLPEEFLARYSGLLGLGSGGDAVRFQRNQTGVLDAFLGALPEIRVDDLFSKARAELQSFAGIQPAPQPTGFQGQLRDYQREGLAWLHFLARTGFGGCLADDMGVGKTPQVLALLETRRAEGKGPSLVVVPRSLIYNWLEEARRFTPALKVLDQSHAARADSTEDFVNHNVVLMTFGTLLRDILKLQEFRFDYAILDEAQAIKNASSESAKAARLLKADHRLVMTGTPIENHLGELWSLMEFLNPGMLGAASVFQTAARQTRTVDQETRQLLARALKPFILRRTKQQVAQELPARIEQTIYCELEGEQRRLYLELRDYYRKLLLGQGGADWSKQKIVVLEALLRLRQSACHPGLVDKKKAAVPSAKLETLMERLREVVDEKHKVLVFSQFTTYLTMVKDHLRAEKINFAYLDGKTKDRQAVVEQFQNDPECPVFLISLKAGGTGLNLTAAEYVFLLDPWWNPAVEAQAIDRAHRIGQTNTVVACRLIAKDTVEERVLELQKSKRDLADAIIGEDNRLVGNLTAEDLSLLLS